MRVKATRMHQNKHVALAQHSRWGVSFKRASTLGLGGKSKRTNSWYTEGVTQPRSARGATRQRRAEHLTSTT